MIELIELGDRSSGRRFQTDAAPVRLGRRSELEVPLSEPGVWDLHADIQLDPAGWFFIRSQGQALVTVNQQPITEQRLRNGDVLGIGSLKLQFTLRSAPQKALRSREMGVWVLILAVVLFAGVTLMSIGR